MSRSSWKDFRIEPLRGEEIPNKDPTAEKKFKKPTKKQYLRWLVSFKNALQALGMAWMMPMAMTLTFTARNCSYEGTIPSVRNQSKKSPTWR
jgi:hypothetical protein